MTGPAFDRAVAELEKRGHQVKRHGNYAQTRCTHQGADNPTGLSIFDNGSRIRFTCFTRGCSSDEVAESLGLTVRDLYHDPRGDVLATYTYDDGRRVHRTTAKAGKGFRQDNGAGTPQLYRLAKIRAAVTAGETIYLVEGEEDVHALEAAGATATTAPMGARSIGRADLSPLDRAHVVAIADRDNSGDEWAAAVRNRLPDAQLVHAATGKDASDHIAAGHGLDDFELYTAAEVPQDGSQRILDHMVQDELRKLRARALARELFDAERRPPREPLDAGTLADILARPDDPPHRVDGLIPWDASTLLAAIRKAGKTTLILNLARGLITGERFLGRFNVRKLTGRVGILNYEVSGKTLARWADQAGVPRERLYIVNLRGRANPLRDPDTRAELAADLRTHDVEALIVDPFARAYTGTSQNDNGEVGAWLVDLDMFARSEVGARDLVLTVHAGWSTERSRGASALEDWPDSIITMTKDEQEIRYLRAIGRDVELEEDRLDYDPVNRRLSLSGAGGRKQAAAAHRGITDQQLILNILGKDENRDGISGADLARQAGGRKDSGFTNAREHLVKTGQIFRRKRTKGHGAGWNYSLNPESTETTENPPNRQVPNLPNLLPIREVRSSGGSPGVRNSEPRPIPRTEEPHEDGNTAPDPMEHPEITATAEPIDHPPTSEPIHTPSSQPTHPPCPSCGRPNLSDRNAAGYPCLDCHAADSGAADGPVNPQAGIRPLVRNENPQGDDPYPFVIPDRTERDLAFASALAAFRTEEP